MIRSTGAVLLLCLSALLGGCGEATQTVSAGTISELPPGEMLEIDLEKKDSLGRRTVYAFGDAETDYSRVIIRSSSGVRNFGQLLRQSRTSLERGVVLGTPDAMRARLPDSAGQTTFDCASLTCQCEGEAACTSLMSSGKCLDYWCSTNTNRCYCTAKP